MGYDLKGKMADMAGDTLKNVEDGGNNLDSVIKHKKQLANQKGKISPDRNERKPGRGIGD